jgi:hypothetical protein
MNFIQKLRDEIGRHAHEFAGYLARHQYEKSDSGILFPKAGLYLQGRFSDFVNGVPIGVQMENIIVDSGLNHMLGVELLGTTQIGAAAWYIGLGTGTTAEVGAVAWTGANIATNASEITSTTDGYSEANRQAFTGAANTGNTSVDNSASKAAFTITSTGGAISVENAFVVGTDNVRGGTTGQLLSYKRYASTRSLNNADNYEVQYEVDFNTP